MLSLYTCSVVKVRPFVAISSSPTVISGANSAALPFGTISACVMQWKANSRGFQCACKPRSDCVGGRRSARPAPAAAKVQSCWLDAPPAPARMIHPPIHPPHRRRARLCPPPAPAQAALQGTLSSGCSPVAHGPAGREKRMRGRLRTAPLQHECRQMMQSDNTQATAAYSESKAKGGAPRCRRTTAPPPPLAAARPPPPRPPAASTAVRWPAAATDSTPI